MIPQFLIAIAGALAGLFSPSLGAELRALASEPQLAVYGPPAPAESEAPAAADSSPAELRPEAPSAQPAVVNPETPTARADSSASEPEAPPAAQRVAQASPKASSDDEVSAAEVVEGVQSFYEDTEHLTAKFRQVYTNQTFGRESVSDGRVWLKKPGKMRWDYQNRRTGEVNKSFISDGSRLWALEHDNKQAFRKDLEDTVLPVAVTFLTGEGKLSQDFRASLDDSGTYGSDSDYVLKLVPRRPSAQYKTLWLVVDPENFRAKESIVLEASGNTNHFRFYEPNTERAVRDSWFEVDQRALRGYRVIEPE